MNGGFQLVTLERLLEPVNRSERPVPGVTYRQIGVRLWGQGAYERGALEGSQTQYKTLSRVEADDIIVNKIWARNGSVAVVPPILAGSYVSSEFPTFTPLREKLDPRWFNWITKAPFFWEQCDDKSRGTSGKNRIRPEKFLEVEIPLPALEAQRRIVSRIEDLAAKIAEVRLMKQKVESDSSRFLSSVFHDTTAGAELLPIADVAPITRRSVHVEPEGDYPELGVRSFGNGTFQKPSLRGMEVGSKKLYRIEPGDLVFSNVFAWEGAVAVARPVDAGRVGSHRFITCVPKTGVATAAFLCFFFLTPEGLQKLGEASPGGAGRNRTLGLEALHRIEVPVPSYEKQLWFDNLQAKVNEVRHIRGETVAELDALMPSILSKAFSGEL